MMDKIKPKPARAEHKSGFETGTQKATTGNGGLHVVKTPMQPANRVPCIECPLRRDSSPGYLGGYTPEMYIEIMKSPASIACHMSPGFRKHDMSTQKHCTGVAGFRANIGHVAQLNGHLTIAHLSTEWVGKDPLFFESEAEFCEHHQKGQIK